MQNSFSQNINRRHLVVGGILFAGLIAVWFIFTYTWINVGSPGATELIIKSNGDGDQYTKSVAAESYSGFIKSGSYTITAKRDLSESRTSIALKRLNLNNIEVELSDTKSIYPLTNIDIRSLNPYNNARTFVDSTVYRLTKVEEDNTISYIGTQNIHTVEWTSETSGYALGFSQNTNNEQLLLAINGSRLSQIKLPKPTSGTGLTTISANESDSNVLYVLDKGGLYRRNSQTYKKLVDFNNNAYILSSHIDRVIVANPTYSEDGGAPVYDIVLYNTEDSSQSKLVQSSLETPDIKLASSWSTDGDRVIISTGTGVYVFDDNGSKIDLSIPIEDGGAASFSGNDIVYSTDNSVWRYSSEKNQASLLSVLLPYMTVTSIHQADTTSDIYIVSRQSSGNALYKIPLAENETEPNVATQRLMEAETTFVAPACYFNFTSYNNKPRIIYYRAASTPAECGSNIANFASMILVDGTPITPLDSDQDAYF